MTDELERAADRLEAEWYSAGPPRQWTSRSQVRAELERMRDAGEWDGIVRGPAGFRFVCSLCEKAVTVPHDTNVCADA